MKVPRSKVKTGYSRLLFCLVFVIESDLSFLLTHSIFALGFVLVAGRWRATGHSRAHGPTVKNLCCNIFVVFLKCTLEKGPGGFQQGERLHFVHCVHGCISFIV